MADPVTMMPVYQNILNESLGSSNLSMHDLPSSTSSIFIEILRRAYLITMPVICITGFVGNALSFFVFASKPLRRTSCSWYLAARSVSDGGFLFSSFFTFASDASKLHFFHTEGLCQVIIFMTYVFAFLSVWLTVVVTVENYIRICRPFSVQTFCTVTVARRTIFALVIMSLAMYHYPLWTSKVFAITTHNTTNNWCAGHTQYAVLLKWLTFLDMLTTLVIPSLLIIILMVCITFSLIKSLKRQSRLQSANPRPVRQIGQTGNNKRANKSNTSPQAKVTRMLFAVSFFFILLNGPSHVIRMKMVIVEFLGSAHGGPSVEEQVQVVCQVIYHVSFAVNLIIYLTCGDNFRKQFREAYLPFCVSRPSVKEYSEMTAMSTVKMDDTDHRTDHQTALVAREAVIGPRSKS